jgi:hypothetical protein
MLPIDELDPFAGSPRSKFFDVLLHANRGVVESTLESFLERHVALEAALEAQLGEGEAVEELVNTYRYEKLDAQEARKTDIYITLVGDILTQNE